MAEISQGGGGGKHDGKVRGKKLSTRVDLTPMVDLAFLLITFFMLTTTLKKPQAMELNMPKETKDKEEKQEIADCQVMHVILDTLDRVMYYEGLELKDWQKSSFDPEDEKGIRKVILDKQKNVSTGCLSKEGKPKDLVVLIKLLKGSNYNNMVTILDEMDITDTKVYAIQKPDSMEVEAAKIFAQTIYQ